MFLSITTVATVTPAPANGLIALKWGSVRQLHQQPAGDRIGLRQPNPERVSKAEFLMRALSTERPTAFVVAKPVIAESGNWQQAIGTSI